MCDLFGHCIYVITLRLGSGVDAGVSVWLVTGKHYNNVRQQKTFIGSGVIIRLLTGDQDTNGSQHMLYACRLQVWEKRDGGTARSVEFSHDEPVDRLGGYLGTVVNSLS